MKFAMVGAVLITLPAIAALIYGLISGNHLLLWAALASFSLNTLPFIVAGMFMRRSSGGGADLGH
jgi:hypothetical protein